MLVPLAQMGEQAQREFMAAFSEMSARIIRGEKMTRKKIHEICDRTERALAEEGE